MPANDAPEPNAPRLWEAGGGRRVVLSFLFLLLLPFYASLGPMLYQRLSRGFIGDSLTLLLFGFLFSIVMALLLARLIQSIRSRVELTDNAVKLTLPAYRRGPIPLFRFNTREIPYADIKAVETRSEIYGGSLAPVRLSVTRLTLANDERLVLGYADANNTVTPIPVGEIGAAIAARAGTTLLDRGVVHRSVQKRLLGTASTVDENIPLTADDVKAINARHKRNVIAAVVGLVFLVAGGITLDVLNASTTTYAGANNNTTPAPPPKKR